jgi:DNA repair exonuclease SbcCD ATPase subunit
MRGCEEMVIREHAYKRYTCRILGVTGDKEIKEYIVQNKPQLTEEINRLRDESIFIWFGAIGDQTPKNFYLNGNLVFVCNEENDAIITIFVINYGFSHAINNNIIQSLLKELNDIDNEIKAKKSEISGELPRKQAEISALDEQIKIHEQQLEILKWNKSHLEGCLDKTNKELEILNLDKEKIVKQLLSINYNLDSLGIKNGKVGNI